MSTFRGGGAIRGTSSPDLISVLKRFSAPVLDFLTGSRPRMLEAMLRYPDVGIWGIGERTILLAGLVTCALHIDHVKRNGAAAGDHRLRGYIESLLLRRTYSTALAVATLDRAQDPSIGLLVATGDRDALHTFLQLTRETPGNSFRARRDRSMDEALAGVLHRLSFLENMSLERERQDQLQLGGRWIDAWPFVVWNGTTIRILHECWAEPPEEEVDRLPNTFELESWRGLESVTEIVHAGAAEMNRVAEVATLSGIEAVEGGAADRFRPELLVPLLAGTAHRRLPDLASFILSNASDSTKRKWVEDYLESWGRKSTTEDVTRALQNTNLVEDAIVASCVERDPIEVMTHYFSIEGKDIPGCLAQFDPAGAAATLKIIDERVNRLIEWLEPVWVETSATGLEARRAGERARLAALEVARALGFRVRDVEGRETIAEYIELIQRFIGSLDTFNLDLQIKGAKHCSVILEKILRFTIAFYRAIDSFDSRFEAGMSPSDAADFVADGRLRRLQNMPLGNLLREFEALCNEYSGGNQAPVLGDRGWMAEGLKQHWESLKAFREWRNEATHDQPPDVDLESLLRGLLGFMEWLRRPSRTGATQVYPAILHLNVLSTNRCGITTVKYTLWERNSTGVALYTHQPISATAGVFYGLPRHERSTRRLWMDPVLFGSEVIERAIRGNA